MIVAIATVVFLIISRVITPNKSCLDRTMRKMSAKATIFLSILFIQAYASASLLTTEQIDALLADLPDLIKHHSARKFLNVHIVGRQMLADLHAPPLANELFCRCTEPNCDDELVGVGGPKYKGICRALGGVCRKSIELSASGEAQDIALS